MKIDFKKLLPYITAIVLFLVIDVIYFKPVTEGYKLRQYDIMQHIGNSKEINDYREKFHDEPLWVETVFGGMPATFVSQTYPSNLIVPVQNGFNLGMPHPLGVVFTLMFGFFVLMLCLKIDPWLAIAGGIAFGFSTYNFLILEAGHNAKVISIAWMPAVLGSIIYTYRQKPLWGAALLMLFFAFHLRVNHVQITYYLFMIIFVYGLVEFIQFAKRGEIKKFFIRSGFVVLGLIMGILPNYSLLKSVATVSSETTRSSESKLTITPDGKSNKQDKTAGLDRWYITDYSYGKIESLNLLIPNAVGTGVRLDTYESIIENIETPEIAQQIKESPAYWSDEKNGGPTYIGAVVITLFILSFLFIKDMTKWGFLFIGILALFLAWGKNAPGLTNFFIDNVPGYNKFRAVTTILVILQLLVPMLGIWGLHYLVTRKQEFQAKMKQFYIACGVIIGLILIILVAGTSFSYISSAEKNMLSEAALKSGNNPQQITYINMYKKDLAGARSSLFFSDAFRAIAFILSTLLLVFLFIKDFISKYVLYAGISLLVLIDMWTVNIRFLNNDTMPGSDTYISWVLPEQQLTPFYPDNADYGIFEAEVAKKPEVLQSIAAAENQLKKKKEASGEDDGVPTAQEINGIRFGELNYATNYRVLNLQNPFNESNTAYFHKSLGGYHGAKQKRIQDIIEFYYQKEIQTIIDGLNANNIKKIQEAFSKTPVLNMMNARYIKFNTKGKGIIQVGTDTVIPAPEPGVIANNLAQGNAWFVKSIQSVKNDDEEITALGKTNLTSTALMRPEMQEKIKAKARNGDGKIVLTSYLPNKMIYTCESKGENLVVFSEVFTKFGWKATIDGKEVPIARANYLLRALMVPDGKHTIEFKYDLPEYRTGEKISLIGSIALLVLFAFAFYKTFFAGSNTNNAPKNENVID